MVEFQAVAHCHTVSGLGALCTVGCWVVTVAICVFGEWVPLGLGWVCTHDNIPLSRGGGGASLWLMFPHPCGGTVVCCRGHCRRGGRGVGQKQCLP